MNEKVAPRLYFGDRLSRKDYERGVSALHENPASPLSEAQQLALRRAELMLMVDRQLGVDFPQERREHIFLAQQELLSHPVRMITDYLWNRFFRQDKSGLPPYIERRIIEAYGKALTPAELIQFLDLAGTSD